MGLAPTTSTTCMLALGDALAVALLERARLLARATSPCSIRAASSAASCCGSSELMHQGEELPLVAPTTADAPRRCSR